MSLLESNKDTERLTFLIKTGFRVRAIDYTKANLDGVDVYTPIYGIDLNNGQVYYAEGKSVKQMLDVLQEKYQKGQN